MYVYAVSVVLVCICWPAIVGIAVILMRMRLTVFSWSETSYWSWRQWDSDSDSFHIVFFVRLATYISLLAVIVHTCFWVHKSVLQGRLYGNFFRFSIILLKFSKIFNFVPCRVMASLVALSHSGSGAGCQLITAPAVSWVMVWQHTDMQTGVVEWNPKHPALLVRSRLCADSCKLHAFTFAGSITRGAGLWISACIKPWQHSRTMKLSHVCASIQG